MNPIIKKCFASVLILLMGMKISAQVSNEQSLYETFDNRFGPQNLGINNGTIHLNSDRSDNKSHRYYLHNNFSQGDVTYDGQLYSNVKLKYDIYADVVVAKVSGENNAIGINLITEKTAWFRIGDTKFVNLSFGKTALPNFVPGYYESVNASKSLVLYVKHHKTKTDVVKSDGNFSNFDAADSFLLLYNDQYYPLRSESDFIAIFPDLEQQVSNFYQSNRELRKTDPKQFMRNLIQILANLLPKDIR